MWFTKPKFRRYKNPEQSNNKQWIKHLPSKRSTRLDEITTEFYKKSRKNEHLYSSNISMKFKRNSVKILKMLATIAKCRKLLKHHIKWYVINFRQEWLIYHKIRGPCCSQVAVRSSAVLFQRRVCMHSNDVLLVSERQSIFK